jgi:hypothetical protein
MKSLCLCACMCTIFEMVFKLVISYNQVNVYKLEVKVVKLEICHFHNRYKYFKYSLYHLSLYDVE